MTAMRGVAAWHAYMNSDADPAVLRAMIAEDAQFHSPVVHAAQVGQARVFAYLFAASKVLGSEDFAYVREIISGDTAVLEFTDTLDGIHINGVDIIRWNGGGQIVDFKVMVRPLKAVNKLWEKMAAMLAG
ncbi:MAG: nuclear transport factor 2 family protein [Sphingopyxis sp.]